MSKINFINLVKAYIKGDDETIKISKIQKKAKILIEIQLSNLKNQIIVKQDALETAKEQLEKVFVNNGSTEFNDKEYVNNLINAKQSIRDIEHNLREINDTIDFLEDCLKDISGE